MPTKTKSCVVWVRLQIGPEEAAFAEQEWSKQGYFSRDDYLNGLLNMVLLREMTKEPLRSKPRDPKKFTNDMDDDIPF